MNRMDERMDWTRVGTRRWLQKKKKDGSCRLLVSRNEMQDSLSVCHGMVSSDSSCGGDDAWNIDVELCVYMEEEQCDNFSLSFIRRGGIPMEHTQSHIVLPTV